VKTALRFTRLGRIYPGEKTKKYLSPDYGCQGQAG
jgi:hypothetical protein